MLCVIAFGGIGASALGAPANAATGFPEYAQCLKTERLVKSFTGEYTEKECKTVANPAKTGKYERWEKDSGTFEATNKAATFITRTTKGVMKSTVCKGGVSRGEFLAGDVYATDKLAFEGCVGNGEKKTDPCRNVGLETLETEPLFSTLVWFNRGDQEPGLLLEAQGEQFARFKCGTEHVNLDG